jgi:hypothetical protein
VIVSRGAQERRDVGGGEPHAELAAQRRPDRADAGRGPSRSSSARKDSGDSRSTAPGERRTSARADPS